MVVPISNPNTSEVEPGGDQMFKVTLSYIGHLKSAWSGDLVTEKENVVAVAPSTQGLC